MEARFVLLACLVSALVSVPLRAQPLPPAPPGVQLTAAHGFEFATVGLPGNSGIPWNTVGPDAVPFNTAFQLQGRGSVPYEYRISRTEMRTGQWLEFVNLFAPRADYPAQIANVIGFELRNGPHYWGAQTDPTYVGPGDRYRLSPGITNAASLPVGGISWRLSAMYCNWLHNGQGSDWQSLMGGAYDVSTFGRLPGPPGSSTDYTDAPTHQPGARYWIPTLDESFKASFFDPNHSGIGQAGWWRYVNRSDLPPVVGLPGMGTTSAGLYDSPNDVPIGWLLPLASYSDQQSGWGLFDTSGGAAEWAEDWAYPTNPSHRILMGAWSATSAGDIPSVFSTYLSHFTGLSALGPDTGGLYQGLRIASAVPAPSAGTLVGLFLLSSLTRRARRIPCASGSSFSAGGTDPNDSPCHRPLL